MKIKYSKNRIFLNGALGATFAISGVLKAYQGTAELFHYIQLILGSLMVASFFLERKFQYLVIENGRLTKNFFIRKTIQLDEIKSIKTLPGRIKLATPDKKLGINTSVIDEESIKDLYRVLGSLELESKNNPFTGWTKAGSRQA